MEASKSLLPSIVDQNLPYIEELPDPEITTNKYRSLSPRAAELLARGWNIRAVSRAIGVNHLAIYRWMETNHFQTLLEYEKSAYRHELLSKVEKAGDKPHLWAANAWILERNKAFGDEFKLNQDKGHGPQVTVQIAISHPAAEPLIEIACEEKK